MRNVEEVNPDLDEARALANMAKVKKQVETRLKLTAQVTAALASLNAGDRKPLLKLQSELVDDGYDLVIKDDEIVLSTEKGEHIGTIKR
jgi:hypothetical protein